MYELCNAEVKVVILVGFSGSWQGMGEGRHTHTNAGHIGADRVQKRNHMPALCDRALKTGVKCVAREQCEKGWLVRITSVRSIFVDYGLEASDAANRFR
jgi:hypothetical protein